MNRVEIIECVRGRTRLWDIVVIGGGSTGIGCALDAASRGYEVLLLDGNDIGKGTSSRSTKLIHGGIRYLEQGNISLVRKALKERGILSNNAPYAVQTRKFVVPCYSRWQMFYYGIGLKVYDLLAGRYGFGRSKILSREQTLDMLPTLQSSGLTGGVLYYDGQFDDTRLLIDLAVAARKEGAEILNYSPVRSITKDRHGRVNGLTFEMAETGELLSVNAKVVINATGAFCDSVRLMSDESSKRIVTLSQGIHLIFDKKFLTGDTALVIPRTDDGRVLFCIPWHGYTLAGTTDTPIETGQLEPIAQESEIDFVLETVGRYLTQSPTRRDILSVFAGIRPLIKSKVMQNTARLSREHLIEIDASGLLTITGGKWTTYRKMAEDAVNKAVEIGGLDKRASITQTLRIAKSGTELIDDTVRLHPDFDLTPNDISYFVQNEWARTVEDILARRTRILFLNARVALALAPKVADIMAIRMGHDQFWIDEQIRNFRSVSANYLPNLSREN